MADEKENEKHKDAKDKQDQKKEGVAAGDATAKRKTGAVCNRHCSRKCPPFPSPVGSMGRHEERHTYIHRDRERPSSKVAPPPWHNANRHKTAVQAPKPPSPSAFKLVGGWVWNGPISAPDTETSAVRNGRRRRAKEDRLCDGGFVSSSIDALLDSSALAATPVYSYLRRRRRRRAFTCVSIVSVHHGGNQWQAHKTLPQQNRYSHHSHPSPAPSLFFSACQTRTGERENSRLCSSVPFGWDFCSDKVIRLPTYAASTPIHPSIQRPVGGGWMEP
ncbi:hypothetical protein LZ31DRAFT_190470 [Colletotrichum somersetense]|nr:hypothetical protein LZ31DRAFT_190470 [Colletotrichum somersetense]